MNILILSVGTRNKVVEYFKETISGSIIATDMSPLAPALYEADKYYHVPKITDPGYIDIIMDICRKEQIRGVLSLIDPELSLLAENAVRFAEIGVMVIGSSCALCEMAMDKMQMYHWLSTHGYKCTRSYDRLEDFEADLHAGKVTFPMFIKPICGSASFGISKVEDMEMLSFLYARQNGMMIQEYLDGQEIGADVYIDMLSGEVVSIFTKKKLQMRAGETNKAVSFRDEKLFALIEKFCSETGFRGQIDIDIFEINGEYFISEVNPRFGGGYPHAYACGCNHMKLIENNLLGKANPRKIGGYDEGVYMMKYSEMMIRR